jgi:hypothetical protein
MATTEIILSIMEILILYVGVYVVLIKFCDKQRLNIYKDFLGQAKEDSACELRNTKKIAVVRPHLSLRKHHNIIK